MLFAFNFIDKVVKIMIYDEKANQHYNSEIGKYAYYVHYYAENAISNIPMKGTLAMMARERLSSTTKTFQPKISKQTKQQYANMLAAIYGRADPDDAHFNPEDVRDSIEKLMQSEINSSLGQIDWYVGKVLNGEGNKEDSSNTGRITTTYISPSDYAKTMSKIDDLNKAIRAISSKRGLAPKEIEQLIDRIERIRTHLTETIAKAGANPELLQALPKNYFGPLDKNKKYIKVNEDFTKAFRELNNLLKKYKFIGKVNTYQTGYLGEATALAAAYMVTGLAEQSIDKALQEAVNNSINTNSRAGALVGGMQVEMQYNIKGIASEALSHSWMHGKEEKNINGIRMRVEKQGSQQKIDIVAQLPDMEDETKVVPVKMSVKNVDLTKDFGIHLVSGTNIWQIIQDEKPSYLKQYLNIMADREGRQNPGQNESAAVAKLASLRDDAQLSLRLLSVYKALTGATFQRQKAELLVVNDSGNANIYVVEMADILNAIITKVSQTQGHLDQWFKMNIEDSKLFYNTWNNESLHRRMALLLNDVHSRNIDIIFRSNIFTSLAREIGVNHLTLT